MIGAIGFFVTLAVCWLGLYVGAILGLVAPEELGPGHKYFIAINRLTFSLSAAVPLFLLTGWVWGAAMLVTVYFALRFKPLPFNITQGLTAFALAANSINRDIFLAVAAVVLLHSLTVGTLFVEPLIGEKRSTSALKLTKKHLGFLLVGAISYLITQIIFG